MYGDSEEIDRLRQEVNELKDKVKELEKIAHEPVNIRDKVIETLRELNLIPSNSDWE